jgi:DNA-binding CsgD family transcriptional regulator/tetratricopeptide (TPR) repeat protein
VLLERDRELQRLRDALSDCREGRGRTVLVCGEPGIGKTSLLRAFAREAGDVAAVYRGACDDLHTARVLGPFRDMFDPPGHEGPPDRERYIGLLGAALADRARPAVVVVDDLHWADDASLDLVRYLARRLGSLPGLLVASYRPGDLADDHPLRRVLGTLATTGAVRLELRSLSDETVGRLARRAGRDPAALIAAVGGNPFYLAEVLAADGAEVPPTVRDAVIGRVLALPAPTRQALRLLSVIPTEADRPLLESLLDTPVPAVLAPAERAGIVRWSEERVRFRHELARRAVESSLPDEVRVALHRRVLGGLTGTGAPASRLVHHAAAAGDAAALSRSACVAADEAAAAGAHGETFAYCGLGLRHADRLEPGAVTRLHGLAARALYALGQFGDAARHAEQAVRSWERVPGAPLELGPVLFVSARMAMMNGRPDEARSAAQRALAVLRPLGPSRPLAHALALMGDLEAIEGNASDAVDWCHRALSMAAELGLPDIEAYARIYLGLARVGLGDLDGLGDLGEAIELARQIDHGDYLCRAAANLAVAMIWLGRHREATPYLDIAEAAAREYGLDYILFHVLAGRSHVDVYCGRWAQAEGRLRQQLRTDRDLSAMMALPMALLGRILARRGDPEAASLVATAWRLARQSRQAHRIALAGCVAVEHAWLTGDRATLRAVAGVVLPVTQPSNFPYHLGEIRRYLRRVGAQTAAFDGCPPGFAAGIAGDTGAAIAAWERAGNAYEQALEEIEAGDAETALRGVRRLDSLGATATANRARRDLQRRGITGVPRGPRPVTRGHPAGLTARQQDVLGLLASGLTSAGIARRLYLSPRTVDNHIAGILVRLGVASRREAVAIAVREGWLPAGQVAAGQPE